jgi:hypothetical protein
MYKLHKVFPIPIFQFKFSKHENYFFDEIEKSEKIPEGWEHSVNSSYPNISKNDSFIDKRTVKKLKCDLLSEIKEMFKASNMPTNISFNDMFWYNIYHQNQGQERHNHMGGWYTKSVWSGVYYNKNATPTTFYPLSLMSRSSNFEGSEQSIVSDCFYTYANIDVSDGDVILFPPYLEHEVKYFLDMMRVTFSFNIVLV